MEGKLMHADAESPLKVLHDRWSLPENIGREIKEVLAKLWAMYERSAE